eukprot:Hpha_TRINITY_DN4062_c0_g1::TRINITY_DN4062_c0_g1_i1::g.63720::m.63720
MDALSPSAINALGSRQNTVPRTILPRCCSECLVRSTDDAESTRIKRLNTPALVFCMAAVAISVPLNMGQHTMVLGAVVMCAGFTVFIVGSYASPRQTTRMLDVLIVLATVGVLIVDFALASGKKVRTWQAVVLVLDAILVFDRRHMPPFVLGITVVYLAVESFESATRLGLYETLGRWGTDGKAQVCDCESPPCGIGTTGVWNFIQFNLCVFVDYYLTRSFANGLRHQLRRVRAVVAVATAVTKSLAVYDVEEAQRVIEESREDLPEELEESYSQLLENLRSYKSYLPHSCLVHAMEDSPQYPSRSATGTASGGADPVQDVLATDNIGDEVMPEEFRVETPHAAIYRTRFCRVSLACVNRVGYVKRDLEDLLDAAHSEWMARDVAEWCERVQDAGGVVDVIMGDHRFASFNARKTCGNHSAAAASVVFKHGSMGQDSDNTYAPLRLTGCVITGGAVCGDMGCASAMRFMVLGTTPVLLRQLERAAAVWQVRVLMDAVAYEGAHYAWQGELLGAVVTHKCSRVPIRVFQLVAERRGPAGELNEEWMYLLARLEPSILDAQNNKLEKLIKTWTTKVIDPPEHPRIDAGDGLVWRLNAVGLECIHSRNTPLIIPTPSTISAASPLHPPPPSVFDESSASTPYSPMAGSPAQDPAVRGRNNNPEQQVADYADLEKSPQAYVGGPYQT